MGRRPWVNPDYAPEKAISQRLDPDVQKMYEDLGHAKRRAKRAAKAKELLRAHSKWPVLEHKL